MLKLFLWLRYLRKKRIVLLSIAAVALSAALLIVVDSLFTGFISGLKEADITGEGDIVLVPRLAPQYDILIDELERIPEIEGAGPFLGGVGLVYLGSGDVRKAIVLGIDAGRESRGSDLKESLLRQSRLSGESSPSEGRGEVSFDVPGYPNDIGGWIGIGVVAEPNEKTDEYDLEEVRKLIGRKVILTTSGRVPVGGELAGEGTKWKLARKVLSFRISDIFYSGIYYKDNVLYLPYDEFYGLCFGDAGPARAANVKIRIRDGVKPALLVPRVWRVWERFASERLGLGGDDISRAWISTLEDVYEPFYAELRKQMAVLLLIFGVVCSVSVLLLFCIFYMIVSRKRKDIAIIKSCGAASSSAALIFLGFGACVGIVGSGAGVILGWIVTRNINTIEHWVKVVFGLKIWRSSVYVFEKIPNEINWGSVWWIVLAAVGGCVIGALIPAIVAARTRPVEILRYE